MTVQLTNPQLSVLEPATARKDGCVYPITAPLRGGAVGNVCSSLLRRGLIEEVASSSENTVWRHDEGGMPLTLRVTCAGRRALGGEPLEAAVGAAQGATTPSPAPALPLRKSRRQDTLLGLLRRPAGATVAEMSEATGWQAHSVRGALSGIIGKKMGLKVISEKVPDRGRVYRLG